jgi:SpoVK/Ycf46/Vps4 family AAA+-type ATPase
LSVAHSVLPLRICVDGKPGTGKTLLAKAIAKESGATFLNIKASNILSKYFGESEKASAAMFSIARKLAPTVIFIDEIDTLLPTRQGDSSDNYRNTMKGVILSEWDGLVNHNTTQNPKNIKDMLPHSSSGGNVSSGPVLVVAATNRPSDVDEAILRRLALSLEIPLPDENGRADILKKMTKLERPSEDLDLVRFAQQTEGFTGSDLRGNYAPVFNFAQ